MVNCKLEVFNVDAFVKLGILVTGNEWPFWSFENCFQLLDVHEYF